MEVRHKWYLPCHDALYVCTVLDIDKDIIIIIILSTIMPIESSYGYDKTEFFHHFRGLPKLLLPFGRYFKTP
jgi:hypothetical protein